MRNLKFLGVSFLLAMTAATSGVAQNPIIQTKYTADPAPMVYNDTVFLYTTHDEDDAEGFKMLDWLLYTSTDMVNWTDHGAVASLKSFDWVKRDNGAWAEQVIERNGKFYMYCPIHGNGIGVLVRRQNDFHIIETLQRFGDGKDICFLEWNQIIVPNSIQLGIHLFHGQSSIIFVQFRTLPWSEDNLPLFLIAFYFNLTFNKCRLRYPATLIGF